jgi:hypothetical protein
MEQEQAQQPAAPIAQAAPPPEKKGYGASDLLAPWDAGLHIASGLVAAPIAGLAGIGAATSPADVDAADTVRRVQEFLTYQPRTELAKDILGNVVEPVLSLPMKATNWLGEQTTDVASNLGIPAPVAAAAGTLANVGPQALLMGVGAKAKAPSLKEGGTFYKEWNAIKSKFGDPQATRNVARSTVKDVAGPALPEVKTALQDATQFVPGAPTTVADALAQATMQGGREVGGPLIGLHKELRGESPAIRNAERAQTDAAVSQLDQIAGGSTRQAQDAAQAAAMESRNAATAPLRESALDRANVAAGVLPDVTSAIDSLTQGRTAALQQGGQMRTMAAVDERVAPTPPLREAPVAGAGPQATRQPVAGVESRPGFKVETPVGREARAAAGEFDAAVADKSADIGILQHQLDRMNASGLKPLRADTVLNSVRQLASKPGSMSRDLMQNVLKYAEERIGRITRKDGTVDSRDLYAARKDINEDIKNYLSGKPASDKTLAAGVDRQIKGMIDDAIEGAGGQGWKNYLSQFRLLSENIDRLKVGQTLGNKLRTDAGATTPQQFLSAIGRGEDAAVRNAVGGGTTRSMTDILGPEGATTVENIAKQLGRSQERARMESAINAPGAGKGPVQIPNLLSRPAMIANFALRLANKNPRVREALGGAMADTNTMRQLLRDPTVSPRTRQEMLRRAALTGGLQQAPVSSTLGIEE